MKTKYLNRYFWTFLILALVLRLSPAGGAEVPSARPTIALKKYMSNFGSMMAGLEIMKLKEAKIDWSVVDLTLREMKGTLEKMQKEDAADAYKEYTDMLATGLTDLEKKANRRDKNFFDSVDNLTNTCFQCHAAHRPGDYLIPKRRISEGKPLMK